MQEPNLAILLPEVLRIAKLAAVAINKIYLAHDYQIRTKSDDSPVTDADLAAHHIISAELAKLTPQYPLLSEESATEVAFATRAQWDYYWLVDPLDGTKEFIKANGEFTVNIALIHQNKAILGVVVAPALEQSYWAVAGGKAYWQTNDALAQEITVSNLVDPVRVVIGRNFQVADTVLEQFKAYKLILCGSSLKICMIARGEADFYPRIGPTKEWDTAAAHCILTAAGGRIVDLKERVELKYNKLTLANPNFIALGDYPNLTKFCG